MNGPDCRRQRLHQTARGGMVGMFMGMGMCTKVQTYCIVQNQYFVWVLHSVGIWMEEVGWRQGRQAGQGRRARHPSCRDGKKDDVGRPGQPTYLQKRFVFIAKHDKTRSRGRGPRNVPTQPGVFLPFVRSNFASTFKIT